MIDAGDRFPAFSLPDQNGDPKTLHDLAGDAGLVLYVYPKDDTPGCTVEAQDFQRHLATFRDAGWEVAGLSRDSAASHCRFAEKYDLAFPLLTDHDAELLSAIGAHGEKTSYGRTSVGIIRSTFVIRRDGTVEQAQRNVRAKGHVDRLVRELGLGG